MTAVYLVDRTELSPSEASVSLSSYGPLVEGTDVTGTFQAAFAANPNGGTIFVPPGNWNVRYQALLVPSRTKLICAKPGLTVLTGITGATTSGAYGGVVFSFKDARDVEVSGFKHIGSGTNRFLVRADGTDGVHVHHNEVEEAGLFACHITSYPYADVGVTLPYTRRLNIHDNKGTTTDRDAHYFIQIKYGHTGSVWNNEADNFIHGVEIWGGDANPNSGQGALANERKAKNISVFGNHFTDMNMGGIWGAMMEACHFYANDVRRCHDVCYDIEGSFGCSVTDNYGEDATNGVIACFFKNREISFTGNHCVSTDDQMWPTLFKIYNNRADSSEPNQGVVVRGNTFECRSGIGFLTNDGGRADPLVFEGNNVVNCRLEFAYAGLGNNVQMFVERNTFRYTASSFPAFNGTATSGASGSLTDSTRTDANETRWYTNYLRNCRVTITSGTGSGQSRMITGNGDSSFTVSPSWSTAPDSTSVYRIDFAAVTVGCVADPNQDTWVVGNTITCTPSSTPAHYFCAIQVRGEDFNNSPSYFINDNKIYGGWTEPCRVWNRGTNAGQTTRVWWRRNQVPKVDAFTIQHDGALYPRVYYVGNEVPSPNATTPNPTRVPGVRSTSYAPGAIAAGATVSTTVTITGLRSFHRVGAIYGGDARLLVTAVHSADDTATVYVTNPTNASITPASAPIFAWIDGASH